MAFIGCVTWYLFEARSAVYSKGNAGPKCGNFGLHACRLPNSSVVSHRYLARAYIPDWSVTYGFQALMKEKGETSLIPGKDPLLISSLKFATSSKNFLVLIIFYKNPNNIYNQYSDIVVS